jgi:hypothetical protein
MLVRNFHYSLHNNPEEHSSHECISAVKVKVASGDDSGVVNDRYAKPTGISLGTSDIKYDLYNTATEFYDYLCTYIHGKKFGYRYKFIQTDIRN